jgi:colanic acid biosynthesis glycosyl transferase WcaI
LASVSAQQEPISFSPRTTSRAPTPGVGDKQLIIFAQYFWPETIGSAPYCTDLAVWFASRGWRVTVITSRPHYPRRDLYPEWQDGSRDRERYGEVSILRVPTFGRLGSGFVGRIVNDLMFSSRALLQLSDVDLRSLQAVVTFVPTVLSAFPARLVARRAGAPLTSVVHDIESGLAAALGIARLKPLVFAMRAMERMALAGSAQIVVLSEAMRREVEALGIKSRLHVLPIWTPIPSAEVDESKDRPFTLMYSGNFGRKQNLDQLLPLIVGVHRRMPAARVILQGDGSERQRLAAELSARRVTNVEFRDLVPADQLVDSLRSADLHLVPQALNVATYAVPSKVFSIMGVARPFVAIAEQGSPLRALALDSGCGLCAAPGDDQALIDIVERLANDPALRRQMGERGRAYVLSNMLREDVLSRYADLLEPGVNARGATDFP